MGKYVYIYYAGAESDGGSAEEWGKWFGELGDKLVDGGNPFAPNGQAVHQGGKMTVQDKPVTGYSIINADSMGEATKLAEGCPLVSAAEGAVCVYEALPM
ncbi:MAG: hypothetical protein JWM81_338 [Candidatus Saccharibacteria bacterium]|nr:hypothetical protein [Candidatus Saccharibacteria bacterium]